MSGKYKFYLISFSLISFIYLFIYPLPYLFGFNPISFLTGLQNRITFSEPVIMVLLGTGLIGLARFARRKFKK
jgi:hypothetical protein